MNFSRARVATTGKGSLGPNAVTEEGFLLTTRIVSACSSAECAGSDLPEGERKDEGRGWLLD